MLAQAHHLANTLPDRLQEHGWWRPLTYAVRVFLQRHQSSGLFIVIFLEELGVPLPAPGDVAIAYGGYLTTTGAIPDPLAYLAVVSGAGGGSACNLTIGRRYGRPFIERFGRQLGVTDERWLRADRLYKRWGIGRSSSVGTYPACGSCFRRFREYSGSLIRFSHRAHLCQR